jgi:creatinine amidohydrolase
MLLAYQDLTQTLPAGLETAVLPLAAMEAHGPHLPLGTDSIIITAILDRCQPATPALRLPCLWLGASTEHADRPGTLSQEPEAMIAQILAIGDGLRRAGISRLVLANGHGGNIALADLAALKLRTRFRMLVANAHWLDFGLPPDITPPADPGQDWHGGWLETSILLAHAPHLVGSERPASPPDGSGLPPLLAPFGPIRWGWRTSDLSSAGHIGRPDLAHAALGEKLLNHAAAGYADLLDQFALARPLG